MRIKILATTALLSAAICAQAQTTKEEALSDLGQLGGVYFAYPVTESLNTPAPKGYQPFYISHYGRHGSRYLINAKDYKWVIDLMRDADAAQALTQEGQQLLADLETVWTEAEGHNGDLTPLGARQHKGIAQRMYKAYPQVFKGNAEIFARSTLVPRCILSMAAFSESLKEQNPALRINRESSDKYMPYLCYHDPKTGPFNDDPRNWKESWRKFRNSHTNADRLMGALFADDAFVERNVDPQDFMWGLYWIAVDLQNMETPVRLYDLFTEDELFDLWQTNNFHFYAADSNHPSNNGMMLGNAKNLVRNIVDDADAAIAGNGLAADLRFGHDGNLIPLAGMMRLKDCYGSTADSDSIYTVFSDFKIAPMAGNLQLVFFRNPKAPEDVLVKFMLNERETSIPVETDLYPFYHWKDVREFYNALLSED